MSIFDRLSLTDSAPSFTRGSRIPVRASADLDRILAMPSRTPVDLEGVRGEALVELMTSRLGCVNLACKCASLGRQCITKLKPAQAWALYEAPLAGGLLGPLGVGHGKTGLDILMATVIPRCRQAVLLVPPGLVEQLHLEYLTWREHWRVPSFMFPDSRGFIVPGTPVVHVVPFSRFSRHESTALLESLAPDLIIIDEAHKVRHPGTSTTSRVLRYFVNHPQTRLCCWSGTLTAKSLRDYAHLACLSLREGSPLPLEPQTVNEWALAIDPSDYPAPEGELKRLRQGEEDLYGAFHRRLTHTRGVTATRQGAVDASIIISRRHPPEMSDDLAEKLRTTRQTWQRPDGEELVDAMSVKACARQLAAGFFYHWVFPRKEPEELILEWFAARKAWHKELRERLQHRREHLDSPLLCAKAAIRYHSGNYEGDLPTWRSETWPAWRAIREAVYHESRAVWVDDFLARDAAAWAIANRGMVWYEHEAFGAKVAELAGLPLYGADSAEEIASEKGDRSIVASIKAHGTGRDGLQYLFNEQLVCQPPASGDAIEQLLGRLHRIGQKADEVTTHVYQHTEEMRDAFESARAQAVYIQGTMGTMQKLLNASIDFACVR